MEKSAKSITSSDKTKQQYAAIMTNYGNCSSFKLCNENDEFLKNYNEPVPTEKDYSKLMMNTPPSNANRNSKYMMVSA